jgi:hypothetical protein
MEDTGFKKYEKVERLDKVDEVGGILEGQVYVFEKLDGANASAWAKLEGDRYWIYVASRNNVVARFMADKDLWITDQNIYDDFRGLPDYVMKNDELITFLLAYPHLRVCGEWLVKHTVNYPAKHLGKLYVFDIEDRVRNKMLPYWEYDPMIQEYEIPYLQPLMITAFPKVETLEALVGKTNYEAHPQGEGLVIKNYDFVNKWGRQPYAKIVAPEFREMNVKVFGGPIPREAIEMKIASVYCTYSRVEKILQKIHDQKGSPATIDDMSRLLSTVYHDIITEDMWDILKKFKRPTINFGKLQKEITELARNHFLGILEARAKDAHDTHSD